MISVVLILFRKRVFRSICPVSFNKQGRNQPSADKRILLQRSQKHSDI
ncbi:hypothetical protein CY0110_17602 [Crocosphaera chwakensis CCY0110]|uniref:Uncharacterized protein n=1 Tax=Crocosphaera chwakensis CCY0110 TaxID=391612 RepID=A3IIK2_9CHRO|nr:hypothetical protein CY0110_17602 [Crocosphaera chwakensis CCY0110]